MVMESRAGRFAALAAVLIAVWSLPLVRSNLARLCFSPGYDDSRLVTIDRDTIHHNSGYGAVAPNVMDAWRKKAKSFTSFQPIERWTSPEGIHTERISEGLLESIGVQPWRGRMLHFSPEYEALASYEVTHGDPAWIGRTVQLRFRSYRITGIMPPKISSSLEAERILDRAPARREESGIHWPSETGRDPRNGASRIAKTVARCSPLGHPETGSDHA